MLFGIRLCFKTGIYGEIYFVYVDKINNKIRYRD